MRFFFKTIYSQRGFTIVELLVVFTLISIVAGIGFASFSSYSQKQTLFQSAQNVSQYIVDAKNSSVSQVKPERTPDGDLISCQSELDGYRVAFCMNGAQCQSENDYEIQMVCGVDQFVLQSANLPPSVQLDSSSTCEEIMYQALTGNFTSSVSLPCTLILKTDSAAPVEGENATTVTIDSSGNVSF